MSKFIQHGFFILKIRYLKVFTAWIRKLKYGFLGMRIGKRTYLPKIYTTYPNQISLGADCMLEHNVYFKYDGVWKKEKSIIIGDDVFIGNGCEFNISFKITIGNHSKIASGCKFIDNDHGTEPGKLIGPQQPIAEEIIIGGDVWLGCNVIVLKGVVIGEGAVVGSGAVVTKSIPSYEIWGGVPAKRIGARK